MKIGMLLPSIYATKRYGEGRIFAPLPLAIQLADSLVDRGHTVRFYSASEVVTKAQLVSGDSELVAHDPYYYQFRYREAAEQKFAAFEILKRDFEYDLTLKAYNDARDGKLDIIHSYHDFGAHYLNELTSFPTVYTIHDPLPQLPTTLEYFRYHRFLHHNYLSISDSQRHSIIPMNFIATIYHGLALDEYDVDLTPDNHLIYFGRVMEDKGADIAIEVAHAAGLPLHVATSSIRGNQSQEFYDTKIAPHIDGTSVCLSGYLAGKEKSDFIKKGKAFIMPLRWEEPFGMVMIEAMACGTPVIAYNRGSAAEIVNDGVTGFIIDPDETGAWRNKGSWVIKKTGVEGLVEAVKRIGEIDRMACRRHVEEHFTISRMVTDHEAVYEKLLTA
ncbi:MAG: glycosyltransferase [Candidatus Gottesmanbacteria bacterium]|nr:glycosyltransferase [Candidatus Gottesmanbacteria bacterium]